MSGAATGAPTGRTVAVLGLGGMGSGMAHALLDTGFAVTVHNRTADRAAPLVAAGAVPAADPAAAVGSADVVLVSLADERAVDEVVLGAATARLRPGTPIVDTSTVSPAYARRTAEALRDLGHPRVEACVVGNPAMARRGELRVFVAGDPADIDHVRDVLDAVGGQVLPVGGAGRAASLKLAFNLMLGVQTVGLAEALAFTEAAGLDRDLVVTALRDAAWGSFALGFRADLMLDRRYQPAGFRSALMRKDLRLALDEAADLEVGLSLVEAASRRFDAVLAAGRGDDDAAVVVEHV